MLLESNLQYLMDPFKQETYEQNFFEVEVCSQEIEVRTTLLKNTIVQIDAHPFMQWYLNLGWLHMFFLKSHHCIWRGSSAVWLLFVLAL